MTTVATSPKTARALLVALVSGALMPGCTGRPEPTGQRTATLTRPAPDGPVRVKLGLIPGVPLAAGQVILRGRWGAGPGMFGRQDEASRPGPMALAADARGRVSILDQVNRRVVRYSHRGRLLGDTPLSGRGAATSEYLAAGTDGDLHVLSLEPASSRFWMHHLAPDGKLLATTGLARSISLPTGLFLERAGETTHVWVEQRHWWQTRVGDGARALGRPDPSRPGARVLAQRAGPRLVKVLRVFGGRYTSTLFAVETPMPVLAIQQLAVDRRGVVYLALLLGRESGPPSWELSETRRVMLVQGAKQQRVIQLEQGRVTDCNQDLAVSPDGEVFQLFSTERELRVRRWRLRP